ncbi:MAG: mannonate dehydratase [Chitinophagaceae bacterium]|nr:MAG: mannonate dehydratase [Chitinophagaceae bacterium]
MGINYAIAKLAPELTGDIAPWDYDSLERSKKIFDSNGFELIGLEGDQFDMSRIKMGLPGRDEDISRYCDMLENMGKLNITLLCYNFMAGIGWYRTNTTIVERGGALVSGFNLEASEDTGFTDAGEISEAAIWEHYEYFLKRVMPAAEKAGVKMALHPDDPPVSPLRGIGRIFTSAAAIRRALGMYNSSFHGLTFCQGTYTTMGENIFDLISEFSDAKKIFFVHIRDVEGNSKNFRETFHDNGPTNMVEAFRAYHRAGFDGPLRSDHVPSMQGDSNTAFGYAMQGSLFGIGYLKGLMEATGIQSK